MKRLFAIVLSLLMLVGFSADAVAVNKDDLDKLRKTNECSKCDLTGADLRGANLSEANLKWAKMTAANLADSNLTVG
ncbi:MAG TPA: hypothetical protein EYO05_06640 [Gammaproteobacteria bacterium]|nr:hypothetical protein [Gammaproteobacteria bacterium]